MNPKTACLGKRRNPEEIGKWKLLFLMMIDDNSIKASFSSWICLKQNVKNTTWNERVNAWIHSVKWWTVSMVSIHLFLVYSLHHSDFELTV